MEISKVQLSVTEELLDRAVCISKARSVIADGVDMSLEECAEEIYAHTWFFYRLPFKWVRSHADPIDLHDGGDTRFRKWVFRRIWRLGK